MKLGLTAAVVSVLPMLVAGPLFAQVPPPPSHGPLEVAPGCAVPAPKATRHVYYLDPVNGNTATGDGSIDKPWGTLASVIASAAVTKMIVPGDDLMLLSGNHGESNFHKWLNTSSDFIRVMAAPGQHPLIPAMQLAGVQMMQFSGIKFQSTRPAAFPYRAMVDVSGSTFFGASHDIIFDNNEFSTDDNFMAWTDNDWVTKPWSVGLTITQHCMTAFANHFTNLINALGLNGDGVAAIDNVFEWLNNDGIEHTASNSLIKGNRVSKGHHTANQALHVDCIQGWTYPTTNTNRNVVITGNYCEKFPDVVGTVPATGIAISYMQGITIFDGKWDGVEISNNVVVNDTYHGISVYGVNNARILNNTVVQSNPIQRNWIGVFNGKDKLPSTNVLVRNNIAPTISGINVNGGILADHNVAAWQFVYTDTTGTHWLNTQGPVAAVPTNVINSIAATTGFVAPYDMTKPGAGQVYDLHLRSGALTIGFGTLVGAPLVDFDGNQRIEPWDAGAYAYRAICQ